MVRSLSKVLKAYGLEHTYDWTKHGSVKTEEQTRIIQVAELELQGVKDADVVIVLLPGGRGTHAELGIANALRKKVFLWAETDELFLQDDRTCAFYWNINVERVVGDKFKLIERIFRYEEEQRIGH